MVNSGDGEIFVRAIKIVKERDDTELYGTKTIIVGATVQSSGTLFHELKPYPNDPARRLVTIEGASGPTTQQWVDVANHIIEGGNCYEEVVQRSDDPGLETIESHYARHGATPMTIPNSATLLYYSFATGKEHTEPIPVVGLVYKIQSNECE